GIKTTDDYFGPVEIYYYQATAQLPIEHISNLALLSDAPNSQPQLSIQYQGCAEAGLCYPVQKRKINWP
ncbi:MAG: protein-disulfide reductase DsbD family protein, partial [Pseudomonadales bacterium]